jgi:eukaryotic-like serine/threonine-protein kinase
MQIPGYRLEHSLEPPHPHCTVSDPVFAASDERTGQRVAVKILHTGFPLRPASEARFLETMRTAQTIRAPNVVPVLAAGVSPAPWFAMEFVDGEALEARLARGERFAPGEARMVLAQLAAALAAANAAGFADTHVIAEHAIVSPRGLKIWNLGIGAWTMWARDLVANQYTAAGELRWHPDLTPDEAKGQPSRPTNAAAALALLAFRLLAGRHYWHAANAEPNPMKLLMEILGAIEPPNARAPDAQWPAGFDDWFAACLAGRHDDAGAALRALRF